MSNINPLAPQSPESTNSQGSPDNGNLQSRTVTTTPVRRTSDRLRAVRLRQQALLSGITQQSIEPSLNCSVIFIASPNRGIRANTYAKQIGNTCPRQSSKSQEETTER